jgi:hypothetical protein
MNYFIGAIDETIIYLFENYKFCDVGKKGAYVGAYIVGDVF